MLSSANQLKPNQPQRSGNNVLSKQSLINKHFLVSLSTPKIHFRIVDLENKNDKLVKLKKGTRGPTIIETVEY